MSYPATWTALVTDNISPAFVAALAAAGYPALSLGLGGAAGKINMGEQYVAEQGGPPRVLMIPKGFDFANERAVATRSKGGVNVEGRAETAQRAIARQWKVYEVQVWGVNFADQTTMDPNPALDYDAAQAISEVLWQTCQQIAAGVWRSTKGTIDPNSPNNVKLGRVFVFDLALDTPIPDTAQPFAPTGVTSKGTTNLQPDDGSLPAEQGCTS